MIQAIACTHAHMDHIGGVAGLKKRKPEANIIIHSADEFIYEQLPRQPEWIGIPRSQWTEYGFDYAAPPKVDENFSDGQLYEVGELCFKVIHCPGHTPGHTSFVIASGSDSVYIQSDVTHVPFLFVRHPDWHAFYDQDPVTAEATRRKVYDMLVADKMRVQGFHYPFPSLAHVEKAGDGYREIPVVWNPTI